MYVYILLTVSLGNVQTVTNRISDGDGTVAAAGREERTLLSLPSFFTAALSAHLQRLALSSRQLHGRGSQHANHPQIGPRHNAQAFELKPQRIPAHSLTVRRNLLRYSVLSD